MAQQRPDFKSYIKSKVYAEYIEQGIIRCKKTGDVYKEKNEGKKLLPFIYIVIAGLCLLYAINILMFPENSLIQGMNVALSIILIIISLAVFLLIPLFTYHRSEFEKIDIMEEEEED